MIAATLASVVDFVFPPRCPLCGAGVHSQYGLCGSCWMGLSIPGEPCCARCSRPFETTLGEGTECAPCLAEPPRHAGIAAATLYNENSRKLVLGLKHARRLGLVPLMAQLMAAKLEAMDADQWAILPVPLHRWRLWQRGYNQSAELARHIVRLKGGTLVVDALLRTKSTASLGGLGRLARVREVSGAIAISHSRRDAIRGRNVLLVDDVLTSGATSDVCVSALLRAGAAGVKIACFARVIEPT